MRDEFGHAGGIVDLRHPLGELAVHTAKVDLLECAALDIGTRDLPDEQDHRRRILEGGVHTDAGVGRARPARHEADAGAAGKLAVGLRHVGSSAFLAAYDEADLLAHVIERVERGEIALAGYAEGRVRAVNPELIDQDLAAGAHVGSLAHNWPRYFNRTPGTWRGKPSEKRKHVEPLRGSEL